MTRIFYLLSAIILSMSLGMANSNGMWLLTNDCECEAVIVGEASSGADVTKILSPVGSSTYVGKATINNEGELQGRCYLGGGSACTVASSSCIFDVSMTVSVDAFSNPPDKDPEYFKIGSEVVTLTQSGTAYVGTSETTRYDGLECEEQRNVTARVRDTDGNIMATAQFTLECHDCPAASGGS